MILVMRGLFLTTRAKSHTRQPRGRQRDNVSCHRLRMPEGVPFPCMRRTLFSLLHFALLAFPAISATPGVPENLVAEGIPAFSPELKADAGRFLEFRAAAFQGWHPVRREMLITTRFSETPQLHLLKKPG